MVARVMVIQPETLRTRFGRFPRVTLADLPTPLEPLLRLSVALARLVYFKRDDGLGPGLGAIRHAG